MQHPAPPAVASKALRLSPRSVAALAMLDIFASIGATDFEVTHTNIDGEKRGYREQSLDALTASLPFLIASADRRQNNIIVRPAVEGVTCVQLDDLDGQKAARIAPAAFLVLETSPGNYQAWVAVTDAPVGTTARLRRGIGADLHASGATRVAGSFNFKKKYAPHFPIVSVRDERRGHIVTVADLDALGVLAPELHPAMRPRKTASTNGRAASKWPDYERVLAGAPVGTSGNPQRTSADFTFCMIALSWLHSIEATAGRLMEVSSKAKENGPEYALKTAQRAFPLAMKRNARMTPPRP